VSTRPSDYRPPHDSPHVRITLPQHLTVTPSGVPQNKHKFVVVPRLPKLYQVHWRGQSFETSPYEPQLAHSTGLPKPPGYNLEWSRVTPIRDALVTRPPAKASHHEHHPKPCRNPSSGTNSAPKPPGAPFALLGRTWFQTAWRASHTAKRHAASKASAAPLSPGGTNTVARRLARTGTTATVFGWYRLAAGPASLGTILVAPMLPIIFFLTCWAGSR